VPEFERLLLAGAGPNSRLLATVGVSGDSGPVRRAFTHRA